MINEASKLRIASDFVNEKIGEKLQEIRNNKELNFRDKLQNELQDLICIKEQINIGNYDMINKVISKMEEK